MSAHICKDCGRPFTSSAPGNPTLCLACWQNECDFRRAFRAGDACCAAVVILAIAAASCSAFGATNLSGTAEKAFTGVSVSSMGIPGPAYNTLSSGLASSERVPAVSFLPCLQGCTSHVRDVGGSDTHSGRGASSVICHPKASTLRIVALRGRDSGSACLQDASASATKNAGRAVFAARPATSSIVTESFLNAVELVESGGNPRAIGDRGRALGSFQMWAGAWEEVNSLRSTAGLAQVSYRLATNRALARMFASNYLSRIESRLSSALHRKPTPVEVFAAWNLGFDGFKRRGFRLAQCPMQTRNGAITLCRLLKGGPQASPRMMPVPARGFAGKSNGGRQGY